MPISRRPLSPLEPEENPNIRHQRVVGRGQLVVTARSPQEIVAIR